MKPEFIMCALAPIPEPRQVAFVRVAEECAELAKEAGKALRFGPDNRYPHDGPTNVEKMRAEFEDVRAALVDAGVLNPRPEIVVLCGSSRFIELFAVMAWTIEKEGKICMGLHLFPASYPGVASDHQAEAEGVSAAMDELHLRKIDLADSVFVLNVGKYVGDSTRREIAYATSIGKPVRYFEPIT